MPLDRFPPAPGQGAICIESRIGDTGVEAMLAAINHVPTGQALACERAFLGALDGSCRTPIAGHAVVDGGRSVLQRADPVAGRPRSRMRSRPKARPTDAARIGRTAGEKVRAKAGDKILRRLGY